MIARFRLATVVSIILYHVGIAQDPDAVRARASYREAVVSYGKQDYRSALEHLKAAVGLMPNHPRYVYGLAGLSAMTGERNEALRCLELIAEWGLDYRPERDSDFVSLFDDLKFKEIISRIESNRKPKGIARPVSQLPAGIVLAEGIAYDAREKAVYAGGVSSRTIIRLMEDGSAQEFSSPADSLLGVFGMRVDVQRRLLWVCSSFVPQMKNRRESDKGRAMIVKYDLKTGRMAKKYFPPDLAKEHLFGDLTVHPNGDVYVSDSHTSSIFRITSKSDRMELFLGNGHFSSLQGIDIDEDGRTLYVADYARGVFSIDVESKVCREIRAQNTTLLGIDGLSVYGSSLIAIQNGIRPHRILRLSLIANPVKPAEVLEANNPLFDEPTLGVIAEDSFLFVANSQWVSFNENGELLPGRVLKPHILMKRKL